MRENNISTSLKEENEKFSYSFLPGALFVSLLWLISTLSYLTDANLGWLGVFPRRFFGLIGVVTSPLIHSGLDHLLANTFPLLLLSGAILFLHREVSGKVFLMVYVLSGIFTWFIGRSAYHIGASGLIYGLAGFLLFLGVVRRDRASLAVSLAVLFLYGGLFNGLFPGEERISWEGHLGGFLAGMVAVVVYGGNPTTTDDANAAAAGVAPSVHPHVSSTVGPQYSAMPIAYHAQASQEAKTYTYRLNSSTSAIEGPTNYGATSSKKAEQLQPNDDGESKPS
ncbi:rhomboid family intramembrane serine protease [Pontibacter harenae]|uniref:rhomboid family intramembrane serine protease n=1 Tax=Pontibacter harenae TaxID=2894083 RepID=UPI001E5A9AA1|nr:rhomboid family intramembrane serine protease [Pontibacter harenae]MCC9166795.1 rhomboid family intramembrane serine protease [Pontibacter harenae]